MTENFFGPGQLDLEILLDRADLKILSGSSRPSRPEISNTDLHP